MFHRPCITFVATLTPFFAHAATNPGILEFDLIFPRRDETYAPVSRMPVVFAVQRPALALTMAASITWSVVETFNSTQDDAHAYQHDIHLLDSNITNTGSPYLVADYIPTLSGIESTWTFEWTLFTANCSGSPPEAFTQNVHNSFTFKTSGSAQGPDLEMATSADTCGMSENFLFNVTAVEELSPSQSSIGPSCAVLGPSPTSSNPCAATINAAAASSISSVITASACADGAYMTCPPSTTSKSGADRSSSSLVGLSAFICWLMIIWAI